MLINQLSCSKIDKHLSLPYAQLFAERLPPFVSHGELAVAVLQCHPSREHQFSRAFGHLHRRPSSLFLAANLPSPVAMVCSRLQGLGATALSIEWTSKRVSLRRSTFQEPPQMSSR